MPRQFLRTIGIDYSGAETAEASLKGLRVYQTIGNDVPQEVVPTSGPKKYWTRRGIASWLIDKLDGRIPTIIGIDHGFSFPLRYFERHALPPDWDLFLDDFCKHWPTDEENTYVDFVRHGSVGNGAAREGERRWRRLTEEATGSAKSVFHFDVQGSVAKSTHAGIPWLRKLRMARPDIHFWPFDGWQPPAGASVVFEAYPRLWSDQYSRDDEKTPDQHDAFSIARWLQDTDMKDELAGYFSPPQPASVATTAMTEGWILGANWPPAKRKAAKRPVSRESRTAKRTTEVGYVNRNDQQVIGATELPGNDYNQKAYILQCTRCQERYGANGSDIFQRKCPHCGGGRRGLPI